MPPALCQGCATGWPLPPCSCRQQLPPRPQNALWLLPSPCGWVVTLARLSWGTANKHALSCEVFLFQNGNFLKCLVNTVQCCDVVQFSLLLDSIPWLGSRTNGRRVPLSPCPRLPCALPCHCGSCPGTALVAATSCVAFVRGAVGARKDCPSPSLAVSPQPLWRLVQTRHTESTARGRAAQGPSTLPAAAPNGPAARGQGCDRQHEAEAAAASAQHSPDVCVSSPRLREAAGSGARPLFLPKARMLMDDKTMACLGSRGWRHSLRM